MKAALKLLAVLMLSSAALAPSKAAEPDMAGCKDHPLFPTRMPEYRIERCKTEDFGYFDFYTVKPPKMRVEGKFTTIIYAFTGPRNTEPSGVAVVRNYENAIRKAGGTVIETVPHWWVTGKFVKNGQETWVQAEKGNGKIWLRLVERKAMEQYVKADATALSNDIRETGHAAVYGITFDTDSATIKPESALAIGEIAKLLKNDPSLKIVVVGHTDNSGTAEHNLKLSEERAQAVREALIQENGIAAERLRSYGCGPYAPVASNDTEEGRALNRRVELVKM